MGSMETPPSSATRFVLKDLDEVRQLMDPYGGTQREALGRGRFEVRASLVRLKDTTLGWYDSRLGQRAYGATRIPLLHLPLRRPITYRVGARYLEATPRRAVFFAPGTEYTICYSGESPVLSMVLDEKALSVAVQPADGGADPPILPAARELPLDEGALGRLSYELLSLWSPSALSPDGPVAAHVQARLSAWIAGLLRRGDGLPAGNQTARAKLHSVEEWLEVRLAEPLDLAALCRVAGIEARGLRKSFQQRRGMSPMQWVLSRRMAAARLRLLTAAPGESVTTISLDCGILHHGRFSVAYRQRYGESPSVTLARAVGPD